MEIRSCYRILLLGFLVLLPNVKTPTSRDAYPVMVGLAVVLIACWSIKTAEFSLDVRNAVGILMIIAGVGLLSH